MAPRILVADDDAWILRMVATVLKKRGYEVDTAPDGEQAFQKALDLVPDLLITDVMMPKMDGWALVRALRARSEFNFMPVIFLTALSSDEDRIRGFRLGADDYLPKPFRFEELDLRVAKTLRQRKSVERIARARLADAEEESQSGVAPSAALTGNLEEIGLSVLLTLLEMERKTGILSVHDRAEAHFAKIYLRQGRVVHASMESEDLRPLNADCIYFLLNWNAGYFVFNLAEVELEDQVGATTTHLLMEGAKRIDEANEASRLRELDEADLVDEEL
jgi:DNA-binding response OmpR family regulator